MLNDARVASLGFFKVNVCTTRINKEKNFKNQVPGPPKIRPNSAGLAVPMNFNCNDENIILGNEITNLQMPSFK